MRVKALEYAGKKPRINEFIRINLKGEIRKARNDFVHQTIGIRGSEKEFGALPEDKIWVIFQGVITPHQAYPD